MQKAITAGAFAIALAAMASVAAGGAKMKVTSSAFQEGANIPSKFTCDGADTSPPLEIADIPSEAKSLALIMDDPDAPSGLFTHWAVWNISPQTSAVREGSAPNGKQGTNDFGKSGYGGALSAIGDTSLLLQDFRARSRAGPAIRRKTRPTGCSDERSCRRPRRANGALLKAKMTEHSWIIRHSSFSHSFSSLFLRIIRVL